ncbi:MAG: transporter substrate-binding domain-containing protein [Ketobacteraceae bacterium]|nr:transporter substrate-binding domain-containing protein [Ketobacteraceae bacterium]
MVARMTGRLMLLVFIVSLQMIFTPGASAENENSPQTLHISTGEFAPWTDSNAPHQGFISRVVRDAFRRQGYEVEFSFWPWKRALVAARNGKVDATSFWYRSDEKARDFYYSDPISEHRELFFYLKKKNLPPWHQLSDLSGLDIGATRGYTYTDKFWQMGEDGQLAISEANSDELNFKKLLAGRIDIFPAGEVVGWRVLRSLDGEALKRVAVLEKPLANQTGHLLFPRESPDSEGLLKAFNKGLKSLREDGTYQRYYEEMLKDID